MTYLLWLIPILAAIVLFALTKNTIAFKIGGAAEAVPENKADSMLAAFINLSAVMSIIIRIFTVSNNTHKTMSQIKLKVNNSRVMDSIENAHIPVTSPTGKMLYLYKRKLDKASPQLRELFWKLCQDPMVNFVGEVEATSEEMTDILAFSML